MQYLKRFLKSIIVGLGAIAPGLSGSVLMVILGLYTKTINAIATLFKDFKKNIIYLMPLGLGIVVGIVIFSNLINYLINNHELPTRLAFFGLLIGTIPLFYKEIKKEEALTSKHYWLILIALSLGLSFVFLFKTNLNAVDLNIFQAFCLGFFGISAMVVPGIDGASLLSALGLYQHWLDLTSLNTSMAVYIPAGLGVVAGGLILSMIINWLLKKHYTVTFSVLFGFFLSIIFSILKTENGSFISLGNNLNTYIGLILFVLGLFSSYFFSKINGE